MFNSCQILQTFTWISQVTFQKQSLLSAFLDSLVYQISLVLDLSARWRFLNVLQKFKSCAKDGRQLRKGSKCKQENMNLRNI